MTGIWEKLELYLHYPFVRYALIVGVLIALCSSLLGVTLVLKRFSFIGDGLSHVAFGAMAIASVLNLSNKMLLVLPVTVISVVLLLASGKKTRIKGDAAIAMISVGALAFGYLVMNLFFTSSNLSGDVCSTLFGSTSILTLSSWEVWVCVILSVTVVGIFVLFYHRIFAITFDEEFVRAKGVRVAQYNLLIAVVIAVIIVLAMNLVGSLLISDAAACCSQGLEFTLEDGEYPPDGAEITVTGLFDTYAEDVYEYSYLKDARLSVE